MKSDVFPIHLEQTKRANQRRALAYAAAARGPAMEEDSTSESAPLMRRQSAPETDGGALVARALLHCCVRTGADVGRFQWDRVRYQGDPYKSMNKSSRSYWNQWDRATYHACLDGLDDMRNADPAMAATILTSLKDARSLTENALEGLASLERSRTQPASPEARTKASWLAQLFGISSPALVCELHAALTHQFGFLLHAMRRLEHTRYKTISVTLDRDQMVACTLQEAGLILINLSGFLPASAAVRAWTMLHELAHLALGAYDRFYLDISSSDPLDAASLTELARQHRAYLSPGASRLPWLFMPGRRSNFLDVMGCRSLDCAVDQFLNGEHERMEVLLHHPDTLALTIHMLAASAIRRGGTAADG